MSISTNPLEVKSKYTVFPDRFARSKGEHEGTLHDLAEWHSLLRLPTKESAPLFGPGRFGENRSANNCLRHAGNLLGITFISGDYDAGEISFDFIVTKLKAANIRCWIYTTASHTPQKCRCRIVCQLSDEYMPSNYQKFVARLNGMLNGTLADESFTATQPYYFGIIESAVESHSIVLDGDFIDLRDDLDETAIYKAGKSSAAAAEAVDIALLRSHDPEALHRLYMQTGEHEMREPEWAAEIRVVKGALGDHPERAYEVAKHITDQWCGGVTDDDVFEEKFERAEPVHVGDRQAIAYCRQHGADPHEVAAYEAAAALARAQAAFTADCGEPPLEPEPAPVRRRFSGILARDFSVHAEPAIVDQFLTEGAAAALIGPTAIGKTNLVIHLLCCIAHGIPFFGHETEARAVALVEMEGARAVQNRILAWHQQYGFDVTDCPLLLIPDSFNLAPDADTPDLVAALKDFEKEVALPLGIVAIDTFHAASAGLNENDAGDTAIALKRLAQMRRETGAATLLIHHTGLSDTTRGRGSSALKASLDTELLVEKSDDGLLLRATKQRDLDIGKPIHFRLQSCEVGYDRDGQVVCAPVVVASAPPPRGSGRAEIKGHAADALRVLRERCVNANGIARDVWFAAFDDQYAGVADQAGRRRLFNKAVTTLKERGLIIVDGGFVRPAGASGFSGEAPTVPPNWADLLDEKRLQ